MNWEVGKLYKTRSGEPVRFHGRWEPWGLCGPGASSPVFHSEGRNSVFWTDEDGKVQGQSRPHPMDVLPD